MIRSDITVMIPAVGRISDRPVGARLGGWA
jgi:hypothetical protein